MVPPKSRVYVESSLLSGISEYFPVHRVLSGSGSHGQERDPALDDSRNSQGTALLLHNSHVSESNGRTMPLERRKELYVLFKKIIYLS